MPAPPPESDPAIVKTTGLCALGNFVEAAMASKAIVRGEGRLSQHELRVTYDIFA